MSHTGVVLTDDRSASVELTEDVLARTLALGLWARINARAGIFIDDYEAEDVPTEKLDPVAEELRDFILAYSGADDGVTHALSEVVRLLVDAKRTGQGVRFAF